MASPLSSSPPASSDAAALEQLPDAARAALAAGEIGAYQTLFGVAAGVQDHTDRYWAWSRLVCEGHAACTCLPAQRLPRAYAAVAAGALQALEIEPREPLLLNWAGVALYELWALEGAAALFGAAHRLDPRLSDIEGNLRALQRRRSELGGRPLPSLLPEVPALVRHAKRVSARAQPTSGMKISLCMIVRDEQEMLPACLTAAAPFVDELVIVDTGSKDETMQIARSFGAKVIEHEWKDSFAEARNISLQAASGDWLLYLDADEALLAEDGPALRALAARTWREAFLLREINYTGNAGSDAAVAADALRMVRNRPGYRFQGRLHEQLAWSLPAHLPERIETTEIRIEHFGYLNEVRTSRGKDKRNVGLLQMQAGEMAHAPFVHYNLGSEHMAAGQIELAIAEFERAWELLAQDPEHERHRYVPALASRHVKALRAAARYQQAVALAKEALGRFPDFTDLVFEQARACAALGEREQALALCEHCIEMGDAGSPYTASAGCGTHLPMMLIAELLLGPGQAQRYAEAIVAVSPLTFAPSEDLPEPQEDRIVAIARHTELLARLVCGPEHLEQTHLRRLEETKDLPQTLGPLLEALLHLHEFKAFERLLPLLVSSGVEQRERRELLAGMYLREGFLASAAEEWMAVCNEAPDARALVGLAQVAQRQQMSAQALDFAQAALACEPDNADARRILSMQG